MTAIAMGDSLVLRPHGDLREGALSDDLERTLFGLLAQGRRVIICLAESGQLAARALGILARAQAIAAGSGGGVAVCCSRPQHRFALAVARFPTALGPYESEASAAAALGRVASRV